MYLKDINESREKIKTIKEQMDAIANSAKNILEQYKDSKANPGQENIVEEAKTILAKLNQSNRWIKAATTLADGAGNLTEETFLEKKTEYSAQIKQLAAFQRDFDRYIIQNKKRLENHTYSPTSREGLATRFAELKNKVEKISEAKASKETEER